MLMQLKMEKLPKSLHKNVVKCFDQQCYILYYHKIYNILNKVINN